MRNVFYFPNKKVYLEILKFYLENVLTYFLICDTIVIQSHFVEEKP